MVRVCSKCGTERPLEEFEKRKDRPMGRGWRCRPCIAARVAVYYRSHADERRAYARANPRKSRENPMGDE